MKDFSGSNLVLHILVSSESFKLDGSSFEPLSLAETSMYFGGIDTEVSY
jgi:hypothetical protein